MALPYDPDSWPACWILKLIAEKNIHAFYDSRLWLKARAKAMEQQHHLCWDCAHQTPAKVNRATTVHHVHELRQRPDLALSQTDEEGRVNLVCLCASCHWKRHHKQPEPVTQERW